MSPAVQEFMHFLDNYHEDDLDYGDFKREVDLHLRRMIEGLHPLTPEQIWQLRKMREQLLWSYRFDVEEVRSLLMEESKHLEDFAPPEI